MFSLRNAAHISNPYQSSHPTTFKLFVETPRITTPSRMLYEYVTPPTSDTRPNPRTSTSSNATQSSQSLLFIENICFQSKKSRSTLVPNKVALSGNLHHSVILRVRVFVQDKGGRRSTMNALTLSTYCRVRRSVDHTCQASITLCLPYEKRKKILQTITLKLLYSNASSTTQIQTSAPKQYPTT